MFIELFVIFCFFSLPGIEFFLFDNVLFDFNPFINGLFIVNFCNVFVLCKFPFGIFFSEEFNILFDVFLRFENWE